MADADIPEDSAAAERAAIVEWLLKNARRERVAAEFRTAVALEMIALADDIEFGCHQGAQRELED